MKNDESGGGAFSFRDTVFAIASGITAVGFWGIAIDIALKYYAYQVSLVLHPDVSLWVFSAIFVAGLVTMALASLKRFGFRR